MMKLIATYPILYRATQYKIGQEIPADDSTMVQAWIDAGTAKWIDPDAQPEPKKAAKAKPVTAEPGLPGTTSTGKRALAGKVTKAGRSRTAAAKK